MGMKPKPIQHQNESYEQFRRRLIRWMNTHQVFSHPYPETPLKSKK